LGGGRRGRPALRLPGNGGRTWLQAWVEDSEHMRERHMFLGAGILVALGGLARDCGPAETVVHEFVLQGCPDATFPVPARAELQPFAIRLDRVWPV